MKALDNLIEDFYGADTNKLRDVFVKSTSDELSADGDARALDLFHDMAVRVPAYRDFLTENGINPLEVTTVAELSEVPCITKENYLNKYALDELSWDGAVAAAMLSTSSGASGQPYFWPRTQRLEMETSQVFELFMRNVFEVDRYRTLFIDGFSMGLYVAGTFSLNSCMRIAQKGFPLTTITPGIQKNDILRIIAKIGGQFDQIILGAYPPFCKDIIDEGKEWGIDWKNHKMRFFFGGESFSEKWRRYLYEAASIEPAHYLTSSINTYGSADAAVLGHETPLSLLVRRLAAQDRTLCEELFGSPTPPSLHQYYPFWKHITVQSGELVFTTKGGIPLCNYAIHDVGGIKTHSEVMEILSRHGYSSNNVASELPEHLNWRLPFVYLFGRAGSVATIYGLNVYPENIKSGLEHDEVFPHVSGRFRLSTEFDRKQNQRLTVRVELRKNVTLDRQALKTIKNRLYLTLREMNAEYRMLSDTMKKKAVPKVSFHEYGHAKHFPVRIKEQYIKKQK